MTQFLSNCRILFVINHLFLHQRRQSAIMRLFGNQAEQTKEGRKKQMSNIFGTNEGLTFEDDIAYYANTIREINKKYNEYKESGETMLAALCKREKQNIKESLKEKFTEDGQSYYDAVKSALKSPQLPQAEQNK